MAVVLIVTYDDGGTESITIRPAATVAAERKYKDKLADIEGTYYAAWVTKGQPGNFDDWLGSLTDAKTERPDAAPLDPGVSPGG